MEQEYGLVGYVNGRPQSTCGKTVITAFPGTRTWTDLNEDELQQGAEGKEDYRLEFTLSILF